MPLLTYSDLYVLQLFTHLSVVMLHKGKLLLKGKIADYCLMYYCLWKNKNEVRNSAKSHLFVSVDLGKYAVCLHTAKQLKYSFVFRLSFATDIARGMAYLHQHKMFHGRLHSRNCVIDDRWVCKISGHSGNLIWTILAEIYEPHPLTICIMPS